jgi:hypothetical protein
MLQSSHIFRYFGHKAEPPKNDLESDQGFAAVTLRMMYLFMKCKLGRIAVDRVVSGE